MAVFISFFVTVAFLLVTYETHVQAANKKPLVKAAWNAVCDVAAELYDVSEATKEATASKRRVVDKMQQQLLRTRILIQTLINDQDVKRFTTVAKYLETKLAAALKNLLGSDSTTAEDILTKTAFANGHIREFLVISSGATQSGSAGCISNHASDGGSELKGLSQLVAQHGPCKSLENEKPTGYDRTQAVTATGFKQFTSGGSAVSGSEKGCRLLTTGDSEGYIEGTLTTPDVPMAGGLLTASSTGGKFTALDNIDASTENHKNKIIKQAWESLKKNPTKVAEYTDDGISTLKSESTFQDAFRSIFGASKDTEADRIAETIEKQYPKTGNDFNKQIWQRIADTSLKSEISGQEKGTKIETIDDIGTLMVILRNFTGERLKKEREREQRKSETKCNAEATQQAILADCTKLEKAECKPDLGCKYNETATKCENDPKSSVAQANQETGKTDGGVKCSDHKDQSTCEQANEGKDKPVCGFRNGREDEDYEDTEKCRNGSFLVNKKLDLSMAANRRIKLSRIPVSSSIKISLVAPTTASMWCQGLFPRPEGSQALALNPIQQDWGRKQAFSEQRRSK
uniref:Variant surface glycoprotein 1125.4013 n=1 Tax=Trypanosoma brucei TaxID=5691 RepID=A0A1J0R9J4_9TRYP|nr:variant surface glycoprotein 1125.4013 [Trypanosoma brucei]